jgi:cofilin
MLLTGRSLNYLFSVAIAENSMTGFYELKIGNTIRYIIYKLNDDKTEITIDKSSTESDYENFLADLPESDCR